MCGFGSNQSAPSSQFSTQTTTAAPEAKAMYNQAWQNAQNVAQRPFTPYSNDPNAFVAPMNSTQLSAVNNLYGMQQAGQPYYQQAPGMAYSSGNTNAAGLAPQYMSPYLNSVAAATMGLLGQQQGMEQNRLSGEIARNGQWGNSRSGVERALLSGQQNLATANTISGLYNQGYNTALGAAQTDLARQLQASGSLAGQGQAGANALFGAGTLGQQTQQAGLQALYNQFLMQQQYPFQVAQFLSSTAAGLGPGYGGTTSGYQQSQQPLSAMGNPLSDPTLKVGAEGKEPEVIGQTNDGQDIYRYRVVNPDTGELGPVQIGLMADEVEHRRPDAIGDYKGFKTVDYAKATDGAARMGGGVMGRGDYASGGGIGLDGGGYVPLMQIPVAHLDTPSLQYQQAQPKQKYGLGQMAQDALGLYSGGKELYKEGSGLWDTLEKSNLVSGVFPSHYASGGGVYDDSPDKTQGPEAWDMPTAKLDAPELQFGSEDQQQKSGGLGDIIKGATGLAGAAKTLWDIGSVAGPAMMALSDRRLKTGVGYAEGGAVDDDLFDRLLHQESGNRQFDKNGDVVVSPKGAVGLAQIMPGTMPEAARYAGLEPSMDRLRSDPEYNKALGKAYLGHQMETFNDPDMAVAAYNAGPGRVEHSVAKANINGGNWRDYLPSETKAYLPAVMGGEKALALAPKEERPSNAGLDAMPPQAKGGLAPSEDMVPAQGISGMIRGAPASGLGEKALDFATSERFLVPLLTGLGAMAGSGSRFLAPAILQGLGAGAQAYMGTQKTQSEIMKNTLGLAATRFKPLESGNFYDNVLGRVVSPQERMSSLQGMLSGTLAGGGSGGLAPASAPVASGENPSGESSVTTAVDTAKKVNAPVAGGEMESSAIMQRAMAAPQAAKEFSLADEYERRAQNLEAIGQPDSATDFRGMARQHRDMGMTLAREIARPDLEAAAEKARRDVANKNELVTIDTPSGKRYQTKEKAIAGEPTSENAPLAGLPPFVPKQQEEVAATARHLGEGAVMRRQAETNLEAIAKILQTYESGRFAEQKKDIITGLRSAGFDVRGAGTWDAPKFEEFLKNAMGSVLTQAAGTGGERLKSEFNSILQANPNPGLQPEANRAIIGKLMGLMKWEDKRAKDFSAWRKKNPYAYDQSEFDNDWLEKNPPEPFIKESTKNIAVRGAPIPPKDELEIGERHIINGELRQWDGSAFQKVKQ